MTDSRPCDVCHIGTMNPQRATYTSWWQGTLIVVPGVLAWLCDVCGEFNYEQQTITRIEMLLEGGQTASQNTPAADAGSASPHRAAPTTRGRSA